MPHDSLIGPCESDEAIRCGPHIGPYLPMHLDTHYVVFTIIMLVSFEQFATIVVHMPTLKTNFAEICPASDPPPIVVVVVVVLW